jgi:hypothetical protein
MRNSLFLFSVASSDAIHALLDIGDGKWRKLMTNEVKIKVLMGRGGMYFCN